MSGESREPLQKKPRLRRDLLLGGLVLLPVLLAALALLLWKPVMIRCNIWELRRLRAEGWEHSDGSDECVCALVHLGALRPGLSYDEVVRVLGKPDWDGADPRTGERRGTWLTMDLGHGTDSWVVTFGPDNRARFVPYISKRETDASGTRIAHYVRRPDDDPAAGE